jgi:hypothetical protein
VYSLRFRHRLETLFAHTYLLLFGKLAVGGLLTLAVPAFHQLERGFYKSTAAVYLGAAAMMAGGDTYLWWSSETAGVISPLATVLWCLFALLFTGYFVTLFVEMPFLRARLFPWAVLAGFVALAVTGWQYRPEGAGIIAGIPYVLVPIAGAAALGGAASGMLLGHWYLIDLDLDLDPLMRMYAFCKATLLLEIGVVVSAAALLWLWPGSGLDEGFARAFGPDQGILTIARIAAWSLGVILLVLIAKTLEIPQTMAATGLFYIQATTIAVGEIIAHWLLFRTGLPL